MGDDVESSIGNRLATVEQAVKSLAETFERHIRHFADERKADNEERKAIFTKLDEVRRPQYPLIISIIAVLITITTVIAGAYFTLSNRDNNHTRELLFALESRTEKRSEQLDAKLQQEQRVQNDATSIRLNTINDEIKRNRDWVDALLKRELEKKRLTD